MWLCDYEDEHEPVQPTGYEHVSIGTWGLDIDQLRHTTVCIYYERQSWYNTIWLLLQASHDPFYRHHGRLRTEREPLLLLNIYYFSFPLLYCFIWPYPLLVWLVTAFRPFHTWVFEPANSNVHVFIISTRKIQIRRINVIVTWATPYQHGSNSHPLSSTTSNSIHYEPSQEPSTWDHSNTIDYVSCSWVAMFVMGWLHSTSLMLIL